MDTKQPEAIRIAEWLEGISGNAWPSYIPQEAAAELRRQHAEIETLRTGYDAARLEIASLRERVQMLGQLARDVNSRRVTELEAQLAAVGAGGVEPLVCDYCGALTPDPWHSSGMLHGKMSKHIHSCDACAARGATQAAPEDASARFKAQHEFLIWNREQTPPPIESATEYSVFNQAVDFYIAARAAQGGA